MSGAALRIIPTALAVLAAMGTTQSTAHAQSQATVRGRVIDRVTREPVAGAVITAGTELVASGDDGTFTLALPPGRYTLEVTSDWLVPVRRALDVNGDTELAPELEIEVDAASEAAGEQIQIVDLAPTSPGTTRVDAGLARMVPGGGDAGRIVQSLPAVARPPAGSAEIVVWGAAPRDTRVFVDGVPVPSLYHVGGYRSAVGNDLIGDITLSPAAFDGSRGRAIGGIIDIELADPSDLPAWRVQADVLDASAAGRITTGPPRWSAARW
jgi:hypothetical protein